MIWLSRFIVLALLLLFSPSANSYEVPLYCGDSELKKIKRTDAWLGCQPGEISLGAGALVAPWEPVKSIHPYLEVRFKAAQVAAKSEGVNIYIASGYRSKSRQTLLFSRAMKKYGSYETAIKWVLPPEISHHPMGLAIDVNYPSDPKGAAWLELNGAKFGLCRIFANEWWHFESPIAPGGTCPALISNAAEYLKLPKT